VSRKLYTSTMKTLFRIIFLITLLFIGSRYYEKLKEKGGIDIPLLSGKDVRTESATSTNERP